MMKKIILLVLILGLGAGGFFYWQKSQADVKELNKGFSDNEKVVKDWRGNYSLIQEIDGALAKTIRAVKQGGQYRIINDKYNYEFLLPNDRTGFWRLEYLEANGESEMEYICRICEMGSILYVGLIGGRGDNITLESYKSIDKNITLDDFSSAGNPTWLYKADIEKRKIGDMDVIIASREYGREKEDGGRERFYNYFFRGGSNFYKVEHVSKDLLDYIITNGKW